MAGGVTTRTTWRGRPIPHWLSDVGAKGLGTLDRLVPDKRGVVIRTSPDFDDQALETARALAEADVDRIVWLVKESRPTLHPVASRLPAGTIIRDANSAGGVVEYLRARVVVHTHGLYGIPPRSGRKAFVNLWHGWGTKRLRSRPPVAERQSDYVTVTSGAYAEVVSDAWGVDRDRVRVTGLPRNDALMRAASLPRPRALVELAGASRPIVVWLPTYRRSVYGELRSDGLDFGNDFQLPSCQPSDVEALAAEIGAYVIVKTHPMAQTHKPGATQWLSVMDDESLAALGMSLYELLGHSDVLVTDYSSVWLDYLLADRPIVFSMADQAEYESSRGQDSDTVGAGLPGPVCSGLLDLQAGLRDALEHDSWAAARRELCTVHHAHRDQHSSARVAQLIVDLLSK